MRIDEIHTLQDVLKDHALWLGSNYYQGSRADLSGADLSGADLREANLSGANLTNARLPDFLIVQPDIKMLGYKKGSKNEIITLEIPKKAKRTNSLIGRKCRAEFAKVIKIEKDGKKVKTAISQHDRNVTYKVGEIIKPDSYDDDIRVDCTNGIHFFITRQEAERY